MNDPFLKPVILGGLLISVLSIIFAPGIFLWAIVGGYITVRLSSKFTQETISKIDVLLLGLFSGIIGGTSLDMITALSFRSPENRQSLIRIIEKSWPKELSPISNLQELLPSLFFSTCIFIIFVTVLFSIVGAFIGLFISKKAKKIS